MLQSLSIRNIALIDSLEIRFDAGLNILTGETGAGKSVVVDAMNLALGERADREMIRTGTDKAFVEAVFDVEGINAVNTLLNEYGIETENGILIITREVSTEGKNNCRINGRTVTLTVLKSLTDTLVDVHGQHEHQSLLRIGNHIQYLDNFGAAELSNLKARVATEYTKWHQVCGNIKTLFGTDEERQRRMDILSYQVEEIKNANLQPGEMERLQERKMLISNAEKIAEALNQVYDTITADSNSAQDRLRLASAALVKLSNIDKDLGTAADKLDTIFYELEELCCKIKEKADETEYNPKELEQIEDRLDEIKKLYRKYGASYEQVMDYNNNAQKELDDLTQSHERLALLTAQRDKLQVELHNSCIALSHKRREVAEVFERKVLEQLADLGMAGAVFKVHFSTDNNNDYTASGFDQVEFLLSANIGEPPKALSKIISGGEMSRFMLGIKTVTAELEGVPVVVFDEIDTGISGAMSQAVAQKMAIIARRRQVICVTHLAQIAAMADVHMRVSKSVSDGHTLTRVETLDNNGCIKELARIIGGESIGSAGYEHAKEMKTWAVKFKELSWV